MPGGRSSTAISGYFFVRRSSHGQPVAALRLTTFRGTVSSQPMSTTQGFTGHAHTAVSLSEVPLRHDWTLAEVREIHDAPLMDLVYRAQTLHRAVFKEHQVQLCSLLSIKTGGCPEDCGYCPQSAHYKTGVKAE